MGARLNTLGLKSGRGAWVKAAHYQQGGRGTVAVAAHFTVAQVERTPFGTPWILGGISGTLWKSNPGNLFLSQVTADITKSQQICSHTRALKTVKDAWETGMTFSKVESWQQFILSHQMASEMECGLSQCGIFLVSYRITFLTSWSSNLVKKPPEYLWPCTFNKCRFTHELYKCVNVLICYDIIKCTSI